MSLLTDCWSLTHGTDSCFATVRAGTIVQVLSVGGTSPRAVVVRGRCRTGCDGTSRDARRPQRTSGAVAMVWGTCFEELPQRTCNAAQMNGYHYPGAMVRRNPSAPTAVHPAAHRVSFRRTCRFVFNKSTCAAPLNCACKGAQALNGSINSVIGRRRALIADVGLTQAHLSTPCFVDLRRAVMQLARDIVIFEGIYASPWPHIRAMALQGRSRRCCDRSPISGRTQTDRYDLKFGRARVGCPFFAT